MYGIIKYFLLFSKLLSRQTEAFLNSQCLNFELKNKKMEDL